jgi:hypothetical protein
VDFFDYFASARVEITTRRTVLCDRIHNSLTLFAEHVESEPKEHVTMAGNGNNMFQKHVARFFVHKDKIL